MRGPLISPQTSAESLLGRQVSPRMFLNKGPCWPWLICLTRKSQREIPNKFQEGIGCSHHGKQDHVGNGYGCLPWCVCVCFPWPRLPGIVPRWYYQRVSCCVLCVRTGVAASAALEQLSSASDKAFFQRQMHTRMHTRIHVGIHICLSSFVFVHDIYIYIYK